MPLRQNILTQLATDIRAAFVPASLWEVRVGVYDPSEFPSLPSAAVWITDDRAQEDLMDNSIFRRLEMVIYGHVTADQINDYTSFYTLISAIETFLYSTNSSYYKNTILGDVSITYGGATDETGMFVINFSILYSQSGLGS